MSRRSKEAIGVFDSGLGGLTVLRHLLISLPNYEYIYLGDNARVPYGDKTQEQIFQYTREAVDFLFNQGCQLIILACNTASSQALRRIQREHLPIRWPNRRVLGVIRPLVEHIAQKVNQTKKPRPLGVIGTRATTESRAYTAELRKLLPTVRITERSTPLLVPLIEEQWSDKPETTLILKKYLRPFKQEKTAILIPACTHYSFLLKKIRQIMGRQVYVPESGTIIAHSLRDYLSRHPELNIKPANDSPRTFFFTAYNEHYQQLVPRFLGQKDIKLELADIKE